MACVCVYSSTQDYWRLLVGTRLMVVWQDPIKIVYLRFLLRITTGQKNMFLG
jgi:hypothetical protein